MKRRKGLNITLQQADAHQAKQLAAGAIKRRGFPPLYETARVPVTAGKISTMKRVKGKLRNVREPKMNQTEREYAAILEGRKQMRDLLEWRREGVRLVWGGGMTYKPDFFVKECDGSFTVIEVKGTHIFDRDIVRFKGCRAEWKDWFRFVMHQKNESGEWTRLL